MYSKQEFLKKIRRFIEEHKDSHYWVYGTQYRPYGSVLIKNRGNNKRTLLKPWETDSGIGKSKIVRYSNKTYTYKGHLIDNYVFIATNFRDNAKRYAGATSSVTLVELDLKNQGVKIYGSMNIGPALLNIIIEFGNTYSFQISYDFEGFLKHNGFNKEVERIEKVEKEENVISHPVAFISYSWDNEGYKSWVLKLAADLIRNGVRVIIDEWDLGKYRDDFHYFMEAGIRESDYVIIICTPNYATRANERKGGVGTENTIITGEFYDKEKVGKYLPIVRHYTGDIRECLPTYLKTKNTIDFKDDSKYERNFETLLRRIFKKPKYKRPELGSVPDLKSEYL